MKDLRAYARPAAVAGRRAVPVRLLASLALTLVFVVGCAAVTVALGFPLLVTLAVALLAAASAGFAAHRTVGSVLAGITLLLARPYTNGDQVRVWSTDFDEVIEVEVVQVGLLHTTLADDRGLHVVANRELLRAR